MILKQLRCQRGVRQKEIAEYLGCSPNTYSRYEREEREADYATLIKIANFFKVTVDYLLRGEQSNG